MEVVPHTGESDAWDRFVERSPDSWFWHTTAWMEYTQEYSGDRFIANRSFRIEENGESFANCPVFIETVEDHLQFAYSGGPLPVPCLSADLTEGKKTEVWALISHTLASYAAKDNVEHVSVRIPALAGSYLETLGPFTNPLLRHGFSSLDYLTQIIDLSLDVKALWAAVRKGHKSDIKKAGQTCETVIWDKGSITPEKFKEYQALHAKDAGRVTRTQRTFDMMRQWVEQGNAALAEAQHSSGPAAFALILLFGNGAFYGSACKNPDLAGITASHAIQWQVMNWLKEHGYRWYDVGLQQYGPVVHDLASAKDVSISGFKRGFGGRAVPLVTSERFYSNELLRKTYDNRMKNYLAKRAIPSG